MLRNKRRITESALSSISMKRFCIASALTLSTITFPTLASATLTELIDLSDNFDSGSLFLRDDGNGDPIGSTVDKVGNDYTVKIEPYRWKDNGNYKHWWWNFTADGVKTPGGNTANSVVFSINTTNHWNNGTNYNEQYRPVYRYFLSGGATSDWEFFDNTDSYTINNNGNTETIREYSNDTAFTDDKIQVAII